MRLEVVRDYRDTPGDYYGDFYHEESILTGVSVGCGECGKINELEPPDGGTAEDIVDYSFTCKECGSKWVNGDEEEFTLQPKPLDIEGVEKLKQQVEKFKIKPYKKQDGTEVYILMTAPGGENCSVDELGQGKCCLCDKESKSVVNISEIGYELFCKPCFERLIECVK